MRAPLRALAPWALAVAGLLGVAAWRVSKAVAPPQPPARSEAEDVELLALPQFEREGNPPEGWLAQGLPDVLRLVLARQQDLLLVDRQVVEGQAQRLGTRDPGRLARELKATHLLEGRLAAGGGPELRLALTLRHHPDGKVAWRSELRFPPDQARDQVEPLARALWRALRPGRPWTPPPAPLLPRNLAAWRACTEGMTIQVEEDLGALKASLDLFRQAVKADPGYAPALAHLAYTAQEFAQDANIQGQPHFMTSHFQEARSAAEQAVALDPGLGLAEKALASLDLAESRFDEAERHARQAIRLDASDYHAQVILGDVLAWRGDEKSVVGARSFYRSAVHLAPTYWWAHFRLAVLQQLTGELEEAVLHADKGLALHPNTEFLYACCADALFWLDRPREAMARLATGLRHFPDSPILQALMAYGAFDAGERATFETFAHKAQGHFAPQHVVFRWMEALRHLQAGRRPQFLQLLDAYLLEAQALARPGTPAMDQRIGSINLYFMARTLARLQEAGRAEAFLALAERLHPGKRAIARKDPAFGKGAPGARMPS